MRSLILCALVCLALAPAAATQTWNEITPASGPMPAPRWIPSAVLDTAERRMVVFGGQADDNSRLNDVWAFDLDTHTWEELTPSSGPMPAVRITPVSVYDPVGHRMITWSGQGTGGTFFNDAWSFDLTTNTWSEFMPSTASPAIRYGAAGVYDPATGDLVTFAGFTFAGRFEDTWRFDPGDTTWTDVSPGVAQSPLKRCLHTSSYDSYTHRFIMYGGQSSGARHDIWAFDLATDQWTDLTPATSPDGRWFPVQVYDSANHRATIFGGNTGTIRTNEVIVFDLWTNEWTTLAPAGTPPVGRDGAVAVYDGANDRMVIFGGDDGSSEHNDVWELAGLSETVTAARSGMPPRAALFQNVPNPFNPATTIAFDLPARATVSLRVYDARGRLVRTLIDGARGAGVHTVEWDGRDERDRRAPSGVYFYRLTGEGVSQARKMVLVQ